MRLLRLLILLTLAFAVASCGNSKFRKYRGPEVTQIQVHKADRMMYLLHDDKVLASYDVGLGFEPVGHKQFEGDGKTPEGQYFISYKNPNSDYHLSLKISYPNEADVAYAASQNKPSGGDIFIHGGPNDRTDKRDWTWGCIAVSDRDMEVVYSMVKPGTAIFLLP
jgi:murein L,D-transpeptidase YafK